MQKYLKYTLWSISVFAIIAISLCTQRYFDTPTFNPKWENFNTNIQEVTTDKGIPFWYKHTPNSPVFALEFTSDYEYEDNEKAYSFIAFEKYKAADFIDFLFNRGTTTRSSDDIRTFIQKYNVNFSVNSHQTGVSGFMKFLSTDASKVVPVLSDLLNNPLFDKKYLDIEKYRTSTYWNDAHNRVSSVLYRQNNLNIYKENAYVEGPKSYDNITSQDLKDLYSKVLRKENLKISVVSSLDKEQVKKYIDDLFNAIEEKYDTPLELSLIHI